MRNMALATALFWSLLPQPVPASKVMAPPAVRRVVPAPVFADGWRPRADDLDVQPWPQPEEPTIAQRVAACESNGDPRAENPVSSASGLYQFLDSTWTMVSGLPAPASAYPEHVQTAMFWRLWDEGRGASHWAPSRKCWGQG